MRKGMSRRRLVGESGNEKKQKKGWNEKKERRE
jgi:hypothetical protein